MISKGISCSKSREQGVQTVYVSSFTKENNTRTVCEWSLWRNKSNRERKCHTFIGVWFWQRAGVGVSSVHVTVIRRSRPEQKRFRRNESRVDEWVSGVQRTWGVRRLDLTIKGTTTSSLPVNIPCYWFIITRLYQLYAYSSVERMTESDRTRKPLFFVSKCGKSMV